MTSTTASNLARIATTVDAIARRLTVNGFSDDITGIQITDHSSSIRVGIHAATAKATNRIAAYFRLEESKVVNGTLLYAPASCIGLPGVEVDVYGPAQDREPVSA